MDKIKLITSVKLKLKIEDEETKKALNEYFNEYGKAVIYATKIIQKELSEDKFAGKVKKDSNNRPLTDEKGKIIYEFPNEFCFCGNQVRRYVNGKPYCNECYKKNFSDNGLRKIMYPTRGRKVKPDYNIMNATNKLSKTHFNYVIREAFILHKSVKEQRRKRQERLKKQKEKLEEFKDLLTNKRYPLDKRKNQKAERFIHPNWLKDGKRKEDFKGYTLYEIKKKIKTLEINIKREEKSLKEKTSIKFKAKRIMLNKSAIKFIENKKIKISISKNLPKIYELEVPKKQKRLNWIKEKIELIKIQKPKYSYLIRKNVGNNKKPAYEFYLQCVIESFPEENKEYAGCLGIDRGINHLAVCTFVSMDGKFKAPIFFKSSEILKLKNMQKRRDIFLKRKHNKIRKKANMRNIKNKINLILHNYSKKIVEIAKSNNAFISFEELKNIKKSKYKMPKKLRYKLSQFTFRKLSNLVEYKAKREGIKVIYVPPEFTSKECSHCGEKINTHRPFKGNSSLFKCDNCGIELNSDYNASINIAKRGIENFKNS